MKNFFTTVRKAGPLKTTMALPVEEHMVDLYGNLTFWELMNAISEVKDARIQSLKLDDRYEDQVINMDLKLFENAEVGDTLRVESNFAPNGKKQVDLKIYVSRQSEGLPARRVCRAIYTVAISPK